MRHTTTVLSGRRLAPFGFFCKGDHISARVVTNTHEAEEEGAMIPLGRHHRPIPRMKRIKKVELPL